MPHFFEGFRPYKKDLFVAFLALVALFIFIPFYTYFYFAQDLGSPDTIMNRNDTGVILLDRQNRPFFNLYQARQRNVVPLSAMSKDIQNAVIAIEDRDFYKHPGFSIRGILRSIYVDLVARKTISGGSTISQQLVKNALLSPERSFVRKYQEIVLAEEIERRYKKPEILAMYLNSVYFGEGAFGAQAAAENYFGKNARDLNLAESSMLAGILTAPSKLSPISGDLVSAKNRQKLVLDKMVEQRYVTSEQANAAYAQELVYTSKKEDLNKYALHFAQMVKDELLKKYSEEDIARSGYKVKTTLNLDWQEYAEIVVKKQVANLAPNGVTNGATVVMDPRTGQIHALVGSRDWFNDQFGKVNIALSPRQPGSSFKPIVYIAALEKGIITAATALKDEPVTFIDGIECRQKCDTTGKPATSIYKPVNYDRKFRGTVLVRRALANSLNVPSVEIMSMLGVPSAIDMAQRLGVTTLADQSNYGLSLVLGAAEVKLLELTNVYATFANNGVKNTPTTILEITDKHKNIVYSFKAQPEKVVDPGLAFIISSILSDNRARAEEFGNALTISRTAAVKTGTTEDYRDAWTIGYTPSLAVGVWVGNNDNRPMDQVAGSLGAAPIWRNLMERFLAGTPVEKFDPPSGVVSETICQDKGLLVKAATSAALLEYFVAGTEPKQLCYGGSIREFPRERTFHPTPVEQTPMPTQAPSPVSTPEPTVQPTGETEGVHVFLEQRVRGARKKFKD